MINRSSLGVTLLETLLYLAIATMIVTLSIRQYRVYRLDADVRQVQYNVNALFAAAGKYFQANCMNLPLSGYYSARYYGVSINQLISAGYLQTNISGATQGLPLSSLVKYPSDGGQGFVVQFNQIPGPPPMVRPPRLIPVGSSTATVTGGFINLWQVQISVELYAASTYFSVLQGNCLSNYNAGSPGYVSPCTLGSAGSGNFVAWQGLPSAGNPADRGGTINVYDYILPSVNSFTQLYTTEPILILTSGVHKSSQGFYICGT